MELEFQLSTYAGSSHGSAPPVQDQSSRQIEARTGDHATMTTCITPPRTFCSVCMRVKLNQYVPYQKAKSHPASPAYRLPQLSIYGRDQRMESFQRKTIVTRRSLKYTYYVSPSSESSEQHPTLLFLHGFPDSAHLWSDVVTRLGDLPNKFIIPDTLGYAGTDKPTDTSLYSYKGQADDIVDILDREDAKPTIIIGHDWGSAIAQRVYLHNRELFKGVVLLTTGYMVPSDQHFDLATVNSVTEKVLGYPQFSYWEFLVAPDAASIMDKNLDRVWQLMHGDVEDWMKKLFCVPGAMRDFLIGKEDVPLKEFATGRFPWKDRFMKQFQGGGFTSALQIYKATASNVQHRSDAGIPKDKLTIEVPLLHVVSTKDAVCVPQMMDEAKEKGLVPHLKQFIIESGHWSPMEKPGEIAGHIRDFVVKLS